MINMGRHISNDIHGKLINELSKCLSIQRDAFLATELHDKLRNILLNPIENRFGNQFGSKFYGQEHLIV